MRKRQIFILMWIAVMLSVTAFAQSGTSRVETGTIDNETPYVEYSVAVPENGSTIVLDLAINSGDLDTVVILLDPNGVKIGENDDRARQDYSSLLRYPNARAGQYTAIASRYNDIQGQTSGEFTMTITVEPPAALPPALDVSDEALLAAGFPEIEARPTADWTIIAYYGGDTNLEPGVMYDFNEFEKAGGSTENVRVVMLMDRHPEYADGSGNWMSARIFEMGADLSADDEFIYPPTLDTEPIADLGSRDTGSGEFLAQYLMWALKHYPAERYAVAFASHGAAWEGLITDDTDEHTIITIPQMQQAFSAVRDAGIVDRFDVLVNDACLMSSVEYYSVLSEFFDYSVASPEVVIDPALDMTLFTQLVKEDPQVEVSTLGRSLVDTYIDRDILIVPTDDTQYYTNALTDLTRFDGLTVAIEAFADVFNDAPSTHGRALGKARNNAYTYSHFLGDNEMIDLGDFMNRVIRESQEPILVDAAERVLAELESVRLYASAGSESLQERLSFYNIYFPDTQASFNMEYLERSSLPNWAQMLRNYYNYTTPQFWEVDSTDLAFHGPVPPKIRITSQYPAPDQEASVEFPVGYGLEIVGRDIAHVDSTIDRSEADGTSIRYSSQRILTDVGQADGSLLRENRWEDGVDVKSLFWDVRLPQVTDGNVSYLENLNLTRSDTGGLVATLDGYYREPGSEIFNIVTLVFGEEAPVVRVVNRAEDSDAVAVIPLEAIPEGSEFYAFKTLISADGSPKLEIGNRYLWPEGGLSWQWVPAPSGTYQLGLLAQTLGGATDFASTSVLVNNDAVSGDYLANAFTDFGFTIKRPVDFERLGFFFEPFIFIRGASEDRSRNITVYLVDPGDTMGEPVPNDPVFIRDTVAGKYGLTVSDELRDVTVDGQALSEFDYTYETEAGVVNGRGFVRQVDAIFGSFGMVFAYEQAASEAYNEAEYTHLRDTTLLFDPVEFAMQSTAQWRINFSDGYSYPIRLEWASENVPEGWTRYNLATDGAFFSVGLFTDQTLDALVNDVAANGTGDFTVTGAEQSYVNEYNWSVTRYEATRDGAPVVGRVYLTEREGSQVAFWTEAPADVAGTAYPEQIEVVIDGFRFD